MLSILYAVLATSFARSENILSTPEGKARSACNARSHGFTASTFAVVRLEDLHEIAHFKTALTAVYQPVNSLELSGLLMEADNPVPEISD